MDNLLPIVKEIADLMPVGVYYPVPSGAEWYVYVKDWASLNWLNHQLLNYLEFMEGSSI